MKKQDNIKPFFDETGKIIKLPQKRSLRFAVLVVLADKFKSGQIYHERQVNEICTEWHTFGDYFLLRRELIDSGLLHRTRDGSQYWREEAKGNAVPEE